MGWRGGEPRGAPVRPLAHSPGSPSDIVQVDFLGGSPRGGCGRTGVRGTCREGHPGSRSPRTSRQSDGLAPTRIVAGDPCGTAKGLPQQRGVLPAVLHEHALQGLRPVELVEDHGGCGVQGAGLGGAWLTRDTRAGARDSGSLTCSQPVQALPGSPGLSWSHTAPPGGPPGPRPLPSQFHPLARPYMTRQGRCGLWPLERGPQVAGTVSWDAHPACCLELAAGPRGAHPLSMHSGLQPQESN